MQETMQRYPDPSVRVFDPRFRKYVNPFAAVERLATGGRWVEGPVWFGDGRYLLWSDIPNDRIMRWTEETGQVSVFREGTGVLANGNTRDRQGRLVTAEHVGRRITRTEYDGTITVLADRYQGKRLNSPNDVIVKSDGSIWFTDPPFGLLTNYTGRLGAEQELPGNVYRIDGQTGEITVVADDVNGPNGLAFSPDESLLYIIESRTQPRRFRVFDVTGDGTKLSNSRVLMEASDDGTPDGFRVDVDGNLWCGWGMGTPELDGVRILSPQGEPIGHIDLPERCANLCFGGVGRSRLFMAASRSLYSLFVNAQGVAGG
jgi:gluconolactonase